MDLYPTWMRLGAGTGSVISLAHIGDLNLEDADPIELEAGGILELDGDSDSLDLDGGGTIELESGDDLEVGCE